MNIWRHDNAFFHQNDPSAFNIKLEPRFRNDKDVRCPLLNLALKFKFLVRIEERCDSQPSYSFGQTWCILGLSLGCVVFIISAIPFSITESVASR